MGVTGMQEPQDLGVFKSLLLSGKSELCLVGDQRGSGGSCTEHSPLRSATMGEGCRAVIGCLWGVAEGGVSRLQQL